VASICAGFELQNLLDAFARNSNLAASEFVIRVRIP